MKNYNKVEAVQIVEDKLIVTFNSGEKRSVSIDSISTHPMAKKLKEREYLNQFHIIHGALEWPNGYDICPNRLYEISTPIN